MSQNNRIYKVRVTCEDGVNFDFPQISANCVSIAVAIAEQQSMSSARCGVITKIEAEKSEFKSNSR